MICFVLLNGKTITAPTIWTALKASGLSGLRTRIVPSGNGSFVVDYWAENKYNKRLKREVAVWKFLGEFACVAPEKK